MAANRHSKKQLSNAYSNEDGTSSKNSFNMHTTKPKTQKKPGSKLTSKQKAEIPTSTLVLPLKQKSRVAHATSSSKNQLKSSLPKVEKQSKKIENQELIKIILDESKASKKY